MGWSSGVGLLCNIVESASDNFTDADAKRDFYADLITLFESHDCDETTEAMGYDAAYDLAIKTLHPEWFEEDDE